MTNFKKCVTLLFFAIATFAVSAQNPLENGNYNLRTVLPPSPSTASLGKFGEVPVGLYTGIPGINIPLYDIKDGGLNVPVGLSYHAGGVRVEEIASSVGIGWALNAGGMIGRQVRGKPDEIFGWTSSNINDRVTTLLQSSDINTRNSTTISLETGNIDGEADIFYYNFNGKSGKFLFDEAGVIHGYPQNGLLIQSLAPSGPATMGYKITTEDGTVYRFDKPEIADVSDNGPITTAWYLTKITSADGAKEINFTYENFSYYAISFYGETQYFFVSGSGTGALSTGSGGQQNTFTSAVRLTKISFSDGFVELRYNNPRQDFEYGVDKSLDQIDVYNNSGQLIKRYDLAYSYFGSNSSNFAHKRLKLISITEKTLTQQKPPYLFTYNESVQDLSRFSLSKDHWGYFNAKNNSTLIPPFKASNASLVLTTYNSGGANRSTDTTYAKAFMLQKIAYPTGGETEFTFESNTSADPRLNYATPRFETHSLEINQQYSAPPSPYETSSYITIPTSGAEARLSMSGFSSSFAGCDLLKVHLTRNGIVYATFTEDFSNFYMAMPSGLWRLRAEYSCSSTNFLNVKVDFTLTIPDSTTNGQRPVGGMRIKQMVDRPGNGGQVVTKKYLYSDENTPSNSSGILVNFPTYGYHLHQDDWTNYGIYGSYITGSYNYIVGQANTNYPLATTQGGYVGYSHVVEDLEANGQIRHKFLAYESQQADFPFPPVESYDWKRGSELSTKYWAWKSGQLVPVKLVENTYTSMYVASIPGYKIGRNEIYTGAAAPPYSSAPYATYYSYPESYALSKQRERLYDINDSTKFTEAETNYEYHFSHYQLTQISKSSSSGTGNANNVIDEVVTKRKYAPEYVFTSTPLDSAARGIKKMQDLHVINTPVEEYTYRQQRNTTTQAVSNQRVIAGTMSKFRPDKPYPDTLYRLEIATPVPLSSFVVSSLSSNALVKHSDYKAAFVVPYYDNKGNILQQQKPGGPPVSYIYGYNKQYPIAECVNASFDEIYVQNFEEITTGVDSVNQAHTGRKFYSGSFATGDKLSVGYHGLTYFISWWHKSGGVWTYSGEVPFTGQTLSGDLDDIRIYPKESQMTTYTYDPLVGMTSATDARGETTYYEYDSFQRLMNVKDKDRNIIKHHDYHYKN